MEASPMENATRILNAYEKVCRVLLNRKTPEGHWIGRLSDSALSTATAISAFCVFLNTVQNGAKHDLTAEEFQQLEPLIKQATDWLLAHQNSDGGWGDTDKSVSNISTTLLVKSALVLASNESRERNEVERPDQSAEKSGHCAALRSRLSLADEYLDRAGGVAAVRKRYGDDQTFSVPILTNAVLAGLADWKDIPQLPFELAALPMAWFRFFKMNVVSYAVPALVAIGQVKFHIAPDKKKFISNIFRRLTKKRTLRLIEKMQPASGGYLEAAPLTSFVVMSLSAMGLTDHPIVTKGIRFLIASFREGGSVPIDTNLAAWLTSLSLIALQGKAANNAQTIDWLLSCQHQQRHPFTGASPGGWGWTNLSGAVPDADDTSAALLALANEGAQSKDCGSVNAAVAGINWLLGLQNRDGGIPTFCQGWGMLPFDKSSTDITAHAIRAFQAWRVNRAAIFRLRNTAQSKDCGSVFVRMQRAEERMFAFLRRSQQPNGSWLPLWFGNQFMPGDANPCYGTAKVLLALAETRREDAMTYNGLRYLIASQNTDGGWGRDSTNQSSSVEETATVVEALSLYATQRAGNRTQRAGDGAQRSPPVEKAYHRGLNWLLEAVESDRFMEASPIGLYFASLWYYEDLYPIIFTAAALRRALTTSQT